MLNIHNIFFFFFLTDFDFPVIFSTEKLKQLSKKSHIATDTSQNIHNFYKLSREENSLNYKVTKVNGRLLWQ